MTAADDFRAFHNRALADLLAEADARGDPVGRRYQLEGTVAVYLCKSKRSPGSYWMVNENDPDDRRWMLDIQIGRTFHLVEREGNA